MNCIIIEDQLPAQRILQKYIKEAGSLNLMGTFSDALEAMEIVNSGGIDFMFLDVHLPKISGIDFLKTLASPPQVILTTAFQEYALESYELNVVDYLLKPFSFQRFIKAISKVDAKLKKNTLSINPISEAQIPEDIYIKSGYDHIRVRIYDIIFIQVDSDYTELHLREKKLLSTESLRYWESFLPTKTFVRVHKSFLINTREILKISGNQIFLKNDNVVPIGRAYKHDFTDRFVK